MKQGKWCGLSKNWQLRIPSVYHLKRSPALKYYGKKRDRNQIHTSLYSPNFPSNTGVKVTLLLGRYSWQLSKSCASANMVYLRAERVLILEHCFRSKFSSALSEAFDNAYPDKETQNKTTKHRVVAKFRKAIRMNAFLRNGDGFFSVCSKTIINSY